MLCAKCSASISEASKFCPECGAPNTGGPASAPGCPAQPGRPVEISQNVAALLSYITFIPAIIFLNISPYNRNPFVRFHAYQSIFFYATWFLLHVCFQMSFLFLGFAAFALMPIQSLIGLVFFVVWIICLIKAYSNEQFKLPVLGFLAERQARKGIENLP